MTIQQIMAEAGHRAGCLTSRDGRRFTVTLDPVSAEALRLAPTLRIALVPRGWSVYYHPAGDPQPRAATWRDAGPDFSSVIAQHLAVRRDPTATALALVMDKEGSAR